MAECLSLPAYGSALFIESMTCDKFLQIIVLIFQLPIPTKKISVEFGQ